MQVSLVFEYALWNNSLLKWLCSVQHCGYGGVLNLVWKAQWFAPSARGWGDIVWWDSLRVLGLWRQLCHVSLHPLHYTPPHTISVLRILYVYLCMCHGIGSFSAYLMFLNTWYLHLQLIIIWYSTKLSIIHHFYSVQLVKRCGCGIIFQWKYSLCDFLGHLLSLSLCVCRKTGSESVRWSSEGLRTESVTRDGDTVTVTCSSNHLTSFAVLVDVGGARVC